MLIGKRLCLMDYTAVGTSEKKGRRAGKRMLERYSGSKLDWLHDSLFFIILIVVIFCVFRFCIGIAIVSGDSMSPTLADGDFVIYTRIVPQYQRGDIVSIRVASGDYYVKRVIATGGDVVDLRDGAIYVNDEPLDGSWAYGETLEESVAIIYPYTVREGNVFVLGDNRTVSMDSRMFGEVNIRQISGRIFLQVGAGTSNSLYIRQIKHE